MNLTQLRAFVAVVDEGSFSSAARSMGLSQPAVTMQVQALEADVGATLLDRRYRRIELTDAGASLLPHARSVLSEIESARGEIDSLSGTVSGRLILASSTTPGQYVLPGLLGPFLKRYPEVAVTLRIDDTAAVTRAVESGEAHLGMIGAEIAGARMSREQHGSDDLVVVAPPDHAAAGWGRLGLAAIAEQPFVMRQTGSGTRLVTEEAFRAVGIDAGDLHVVTELGSSEAIVNAVEGGLGLAVVSSLVADKALKLGTVVALPVEGFPLERPLYVVWPSGEMTRAAEAFLGYLRERL